MTAIVSQDYVDDRADALAAANLNGLKLALVSLPPGPAPGHADIDLRFFNGLFVASILAEITATPTRAGQIFRIRGGTRVPAGTLPGQVRCTAVVAGSTAEQLSLRIEPVGDYSTYTIELVWDASRIDPFFSGIGFRFRPGCFTNDCAPTLPGRPLAPGPRIDYLAKDYDSFRHTLMVAMAERVPGWRSTSEADLDQVLIDLFAAAGDEISDFQDRVSAEAYLATARQRVSLARHARLMDYHVNEGHQASTWLGVIVSPGQAPFRLDSQQLVCWTGAATPLADESVFFASRDHWLPAARRQRLDPLVNELHLHTWRGAQPALRAGSTSADVTTASATKLEADTLRDLVQTGALPRLLIAEVLNPRTGQQPGRDARKRQLLRLVPGATGMLAARTIHDPLTNTFLVRLWWQEADALRQDYCFTTVCNGTPVDNISVFHGNLLPMHAGEPMAVFFHEPGSALPAETAEVKQRHFQRGTRHGGFDWVLAALPVRPNGFEAPLAYLPTPRGGEIPAKSTLRVEVTVPLGGTDVWDEVESLVHSDDNAELGDQFIVETDERRHTVLRFGNGTNGQLLPEGAVIHAQYQTGTGVEGNIGSDQLIFARGLTGSLSGAIQRVWNPFDVSDGRAPETPDKIRRNAPEAYRSRQLRAVTLADYVRRAEEVDGVSRAVARYAWTGSWRTVRVTIDPAGTTAFDDALRQRVADHLESVRLIGEDLELRPPRFVPLDVRIVVCLAPEFWREDLRFILDQEFGTRYTSDGRRGFFHPDHWTFGQALHRSQLEGRLQQVPGVAHVVSITMKRFNAPTPGLPGMEALEMAFDEVVLLANDPDHLERGLIRFELRGGRV
ncbi:baseplate J/gp47 family protein [Roseateles cellulosilyticus]|uniref:Baseplate J/gp47 family protein n=1 Tax=Pelomonas cellulosilytica TaxID=2906762 RepID=A0ABS8XYM1_9BURK|nr:baseplate J/gp47 family protein [Pelomonas sp. P8]MCE4555808.1 baseplate J/gp47 family protein [Pelomonas sp. P8]